MPKWPILLLIALLTGCTEAASSKSQTFAGWYIQNASDGASLSTCDGDRWKLRDVEAVKQRAREFGLAANTPVYVRLKARKATGDRGLVVEDVVQFGAEQPVRNCPMTGVVTSPAGA